MPTYKPNNIRFTKHWSQFFDQIVPHYVKSHYSPNSKWKSLPYGPKDTLFFFKGVKELSHRFRERHTVRGSYLDHEKFRSSYLLYFFPFQTAKFYSLFTAKGEFLKKNMPETLSIADYGCGPGTASFAFLLWVIASKRSPKKIELHLIDTNKKILNDAKNLMQLFLETFELNDTVNVTIHVQPWWAFKKPVDLALFGHVLNELKRSDTRSENRLLEINASPPRLGILYVEPAEKAVSQHLSRLRDECIRSESTFILTPCLHQDVCPLAMGRDWCHFSENVVLPGQVVQKMGQLLGSKRKYIKYSHLWLVPKSLPLKYPKGKARVVSDLIDGPGGSFVLICQPVKALRLKTTARVQRGQIIEIK